MRYTPAMPHHGRGIRCVIWNQAGPGIPEPLALALERQSVESVQSPDAAIAFAEVLALHAEKSVHPILVLVEQTPGPRSASGWPGAVREMLEAMDAYLSETPIWLYSPIGSPRLRALGTADRLRWTTPEVRIPLRAGGLRLVGDAGEPASRGGEAEQLVEPKAAEARAIEPKVVEPEVREPAELLTPEEIDALMGHPFDRPGQGPARGQR